MRSKVRLLTKMAAFLGLGVVLLIAFLFLLKRSGFYPPTGIHPCEPAMFVNGVVPPQCLSKTQDSPSR